MLEDERLSFKAKGILSFLLSRSDDWDVYQSHIEELGPDGESAVRTGIQELVDAGYLDREQRRNNDGTFEEWVYIIYETPLDDAASRTGFSSTGLSSTGSSSTGKARPTNTDKYQDESKTNTTAATADAPANTREGPDPFSVEQNDVDAITEEAFGTAIQGLSIKDQIEQKCEKSAPEGWDCLRAVCQTIIDKEWNPSAALVKTRLEQQIQMINSSDEQQQDDFAEKAKSIFEAAGRGAGVYE